MTITIIKKWTNTNLYSLYYSNTISILLYSSKPPFVYFFNPKLDVEIDILEGDEFKAINIGFRNKEDVRIKK